MSFGTIFEHEGNLVVEGDPNYGVFGIVLVPTGATVIDAVEGRAGEPYSVDNFRDTGVRDGWYVVGRWTNNSLHPDTTIVEAGYTHNGSFAEWAMLPDHMAAFGLERTAAPGARSTDIRVRWGG